MSNNNDYNNGYWFGKDSGYREGYEEGVQAERNRAKRAIEGGNGSPASESSVLSWFYCDDEYRRSDDGDYGRV